MRNAPRTRLFRHEKLSLFLNADEIVGYSAGEHFVSIYFKGGGKTMLWSDKSQTFANPKWPDPLFQTIVLWLNQIVGGE